METKLRGTFEMRSDWVAELRSALEAKVDYASTTNNYADLLAKSHTPVRFEQLRGMINPKKLRKVVKEKSMLVFRSSYKLHKQTDLCFYGPGHLICPWDSKTIQ